MRALLLTAMVLVVGISACTAAWCQQSASPYNARIIATQVGNSDSTVWNYTVSNTSIVPSYTLWLIAIEVDEGNDALSVLKPAGWSSDPNDELSPTNLISWMAYGENIAANDSLSGFQATYASVPLTQTFSVMFDNSETNESGIMDGVVEVSVAPEPANVAILLTGLASAVALKQKQRRKA